MFFLYNTQKMLVKWRCFIVLLIQHTFRTDLFHLYALGDYAAEVLLHF